MKGLILVYIVTYGGALAALRYPLVGLYVYIALAVLRPQAIFSFAGDLSGMSQIVGVAVLIGWALQGLGRWQFGRGRIVVAAFLAFTTWFVLSASQAIDTTVAYDSLWELSKLIFPFLVGATLLQAKDSKPLLWTIVLAQGYVGFENNLNYLKGFNTAAEGFAGMDNNCFGVSLVTVIGPALALTLATRSWSARLLAAAATALILHTAMLTYSRGAMLGLLAVGLMAFMMMPKKPLYIGSLLVVVLLAVRLTGPQLMERYSTTFVSADERDESSESRVDLWRDCLLVVARFPVMGVGPANWRVIANSYGWPPGKSAHSVWMETAAELGIPGVLILLAFFTSAAVRLWPIARMKINDSNRYEVAVATGVLLSIVGFAISGQFVSVPGLEVPYYVVMLGAVLIRDAKREVVVAAPATGVSSTPRLAKTPVPLTPLPGRRSWPERG